MFFSPFAKHLQESSGKSFSTLYQDDDISRENIRVIGAIAFVPLPDIIMAFGALCVHCGANGNERVILRYFERNYIGDLRAGVRAVPLVRECNCPEGSCPYLNSGTEGNCP